MRLLLLIAFAAVVTEAAVYQATTRKTESLRHRLLKAGMWRQFLQEQNKARGQGSHWLIDYFDDFYLANVTFGSPPQRFEMVPDTGSSTVWVVGTQCSSTACFGQGGFTKNRFDATLSSTYESMGKMFRIQYGSGSSFGYMATDSISFASLRYTKQAFGVAVSISSVFGYQPIDGILGLGWPSLASADCVPPLQNLLPQLDQPLFTVYFSRNTPYSPNAVDGGVITYGSIDTRHCAPQITYVPLSSRSYWQFPLQGVRLGSYSSYATQQAISDTGTSWIGGPDSIIEGLVAAVNGKFDANDEFYKVDCGAMNSDTNLMLTINGRNYEIPAVQYVLDLGLGNNDCALTFFTVSYSGFGPQWILGATFIRTYCQIYDIGNAMIGFAKAYQY